MDASFGGAGIERRWTGRLAGGGMVGGVLAAMLISTLFLTRFALTIGKSELSLPLVVVLIGTALLAVTGAVRVSPTRATLFAVVVAVLLMSLMFGDAMQPSYPSFLNSSCSTPPGCSSCPTTGSSSARCGSRAGCC